MVHDQARHARRDDGKSEAEWSPLARIRTTWRAINRLRSGIGLRLLTRVVLFSSAITLLLTLFQLYLDYRRDVGTIEYRMSEIEGSYLRSLGEGLWNLDARQLELQVDGILRLPAIRFVEVREATDRADPMVVSAGSRQGGAAVQGEFPIFHTFRGAEQQLGVLTIEATLDEIYRRLLDTRSSSWSARARRRLPSRFSFFLLSIGSSRVTSSRSHGFSPATTFAFRRRRCDWSDVRLVGPTSSTSWSRRSTACPQAC